MRCWGWICGGACTALVLVSCQVASHETEFIPGSDISLILGRGAPLKMVWVADLEMWVGRYEVTVGRFREWRRDHPKEPANQNNPVVWMTGKQAETYCRCRIRNRSGRRSQPLHARLLLGIPSWRC